MKNLSHREGFLNRHITELPTKKCVMKVVTNDIDGEHIDLCEWEPFDIGKYNGKTLPAEGYIGTVSVIEGRYIGIGFHAWQQNDSEFIWYSIVE